MNVVKTDTATTMGYRKSLVTPSDVPRVARMKANSPICVSEKEHFMEVFRDWPESRNPQVLRIVWPSMTAAMMLMMGTIYSMMRFTSTIMPTDTKKIAPKRFFTGATRCSICSASTVSAKMLPITKAPKAAEKPAAEAATTMPKQRARAVISSVSSFISGFSLRRAKGMK